jgi:subtilisin family serine protease
MLWEGMWRRLLITTLLTCLLACAAALATGSLASAGSALDQRERARQLILEKRTTKPTQTFPGTRLLATSGLTRVIVGVDNAAELPRLAARLRAVGAETERVPRLAALAVGEVSASLVVALLRSDSAVTFIEEDRSLDSLADPFDSIDSATGINYQWAFDAIGAGAAIAAVGGGSQYAVAVIDTGVEVDHPDLAGRIAASYSALDGGAVVTDELGHGTFVAGLISAIDGNGLGGKGAAGATNLLAVKASSPGGEFYESQLAQGIVWSTDAGARVINMSLGGLCPAGQLIASALDYAYANNVLVVAAAGNNAELGNQPNCPAAHLGGVDGAWGTGLSVGATGPTGLRAPFSTFNQNVSIAAPGSGGGDCRYGVFSTVPSTPNLWDGGCSTLFGPLEVAPARWAYGEGTSFAAPLVSAVASLALQANPNLFPEQLAEVLKRSALQTIGEGWNPETGAGIVNAAGAVDLARRFDSLEPSVELKVSPRARGLKVVVDATDAAREGEGAANGATFWIERSRDGVSFVPWTPERSDRIVRTLKASRRGPAYWFRAFACDAHRNCVSKTVGPKRPVRVKPTVKVRTQRLPDGSRRAIVTLKRVKGMTGRATVVLEQKAKRRFKPIGTFKLAFGKSQRKKLDIASGERFRLRARVKRAPDWRAVRSRAISVASTGT